MLPALQPSRPKVSQQESRPSYIHQQRRFIQPQQQQQQQPSRPQTIIPTVISTADKPRSQIEAMPPFPAGPQTPFFQSRTFGPTPVVYDSATRHPVFFTAQLKKPPFPLPEMASQGFNPVAHGYILEKRRSDSATIPKTKL